MPARCGGGIALAYRYEEYSIVDREEQEDSLMTNVVRESSLSVRIGILFVVYKYKHLDVNYAPSISNRRRLPIIMFYCCSNSVIIIYTSSHRDALQLPKFPLLYYLLSNRRLHVLQIIRYKI